LLSYLNLLKFKKFCFFKASFLEHLLMGQCICCPQWQQASSLEVYRQSSSCRIWWRQGGAHGSRR